jgi:hypothetical protein
MLHSQGTTLAIVTGQAGAGQVGNFTFTYEVTSKGSNGWDLKPGEIPSVSVWSNEAIWQIKYTSTSGDFTSANAASGVADFVYTCDSGAENLIWCYKSTKESYTGTLPWSFVPSP